jgi:hypothetical protein
MKSVILRALWVALAVFSAVSYAAPTYISNGLMTWQRGVAGSTWQQWTFDTNQNPAIPETYYNPYGDPQIQLTGSSGSTPFMWKNGVWMGDPVCAQITVPNDPQPNPSKTIWFEMVYKAVDSILPSVSAGESYDVQQTYFSDRAYEGAWRIMTFGWTIEPSPSTEQFTFALAGTGGFVTSVSIDTICTVPAPDAAMLATVGLGLIGLMRKRFFC